MDYDELRDVYKNKSFFRKIKLNKQPNILDKSYALKVTPYSDFSSEEIDLKYKKFKDENFIKNLTQILQEESRQTFKIIKAKKKNLKKRQFMLIILIKKQNVNE